jgi:hypothetical protein
MALQYSVGYRTAAMTALAGQVTNTGRIVLYGGTPPVNCATAYSATSPLATWVSNATQFGLASTGVLTVSALVASTVVAGAGAPGTATWFAIYPTATTTGTDRVVQGTVGLSGADWTITNTSIAASQNVTLNNSSAPTFTAGNP